MKTQRLTVRLSPNTHSNLKLAAQECGMTMRQWVEIAILEKVGKIPGRDASKEMGTP